MKKVELLSPAGSIEAFYASINAGADAIYLGGKSFSARAFANNFSNEKIAELIEYAHIHKVKVYITINTLIFEEEIKSCLDFIEFLYHHDVDGILLQDIGLTSLIHQKFPDLILHASTQLNCHNVAQAKALINLGFSRIVLARETPLDIVKKIKNLGVEVEVFVHGALCVCYSGLCLMSSFIGGRSGNRGRCAQPCRNKMNVVSKDFISNDYAISTKDLNTIEYIDKLIEAGVDSLKIEGRMKREEYVYQVVSAYRKSIDAYYKKERIDFKKESEDINKLFSRGNTKGFLFNEARTNLLNQKTSSHQGVHLGTVIGVKKDGVLVKIDSELNLNDGIRFNNKYQTGQLVQNMRINDKEVIYAKKGDIVFIKKYDVKVYVNDEVIKTSDYHQLNMIKKQMEKEKKVGISLVVKAFLDSPLILELTFNDMKIKVQSDYLIEKAKMNETSEEYIIHQLSKLGNTPFVIDNLSLKKDEGIFIPLKTINDIRRKGVNELIELIKKSNKYQLINNEYVPLVRKVEQEKDFYLDVQVENEEQLLEVMKYPYKHIFIQNKTLFEQYKNDDRMMFSLNRINDLDEQIGENRQIIPYLKEVKGTNIYTSPYFYVVNSYSLEYVYSLGYNNAILSYELSKDRIFDLINEYFARNFIYPRVSMPLYGYIDLMIIKSCPIATSLGIKKDHCNLCKKQSFELKDRYNETYLMMHDESCNTRILNSYPLFLLDNINELKSMHISSGVIYFTIESIEQVKRISSLAFDALDNKMIETIKNTTKGHYLKKID
ncbi:MAG: U32 family peptidase [Bacillales bacterium]|nr:U32 family peptidase [Bacillales bacterium]